MTCVIVMTRVGRLRVLVPVRLHFFLANASFKVLRSAAWPAASRVLAATETAPTMLNQQPATRRRRWPIFVPFALLVALAVIWTGLWFYAASAAETALAGWRAREAKSGRTYEC